MNIGDFEIVKINGVKPAAVIIPVINDGGVRSVVLEVRADGIRQAGEVCFPGGRIDDGEEALDAALREIKEELLISDDNIINVKPKFITMGPRLEPVFVYECELIGYENSYNKSEVSKVLTISFDWLKDNEHILPEERMKTQCEYIYDTHRIWGMTARVINWYLKGLEL